VLTNHHVVDGASEVIVHLTDRRELKAKVIGSDPTSDVAVLKVEASNLPVLQLSDSRNLKPGQWVLAIGSPFGFDHSVTAGVVSGLGRPSLDSSQRYVPFIQTDVAINRGNSGGPLLNTSGEVVGINSQIFSNSGGYMGVSFAIPIEVAMNAVRQIRATGHVTRGQLGVQVGDVQRDQMAELGLASASGAFVGGVQNDSAAARAGIKPGRRDHRLSTARKSARPRSCRRWSAACRPGRAPTSSCCATASRWTSWWCSRRSRKHRATGPADAESVLARGRPQHARHRRHRTRFRRAAASWA
jgi:serine protease Do